jgi:hypothetical protein
MQPLPSPLPAPANTVNSWQRWQNNANWVPSLLLFLNITLILQSINSHGFFFFFGISFSYPWQILQFPSNRFFVMWSSLFALHCFPSSGMLSLASKVCLSLTRSKGKRAISMLYVLDCRSTCHFGRLVKADRHHFFNTRFQKLLSRHNDRSSCSQNSYCVINVWIPAWSSHESRLQILIQRTDTESLAFDFTSQASPVDLAARVAPGLFRYLVPFFVIDMTRLFRMFWEIICCMIACLLLILTARMSSEPVVSVVHVVRPSLLPIQMSSGHLSH